MVTEPVKYPSISVFFPCLNEEENVERVTTSTLSLLESLGIDYEVIIVNDASTDRTPQIIDDLVHKYERVRAVHIPVSIGYGNALKAGFRAATKELVFYTDGDGQFNIGELPPLIPLMRKYEIVTCYRMDRKDNLFRKISGWAWTKLACALFGLRLKDIDCAFKLFRRDIFDNIEMHSNGAMIDTEILARAHYKGYAMIQKPVSHYPRIAGKQTGGDPAVVINAFVELSKLYLLIRRDRKQQP